MPSIGCLRWGPPWRRWRRRGMGPGSVCCASWLRWAGLGWGVLHACERGLSGTHSRPCSLAAWHCSCPASSLLNCPATANCCNMHPRAECTAVPRQLRRLQGAAQRAFHPGCAGGLCRRHAPRGGAPWLRLLPPHLCCLGRQRRQQWQERQLAATEAAGAVEPRSAGQQRCRQHTGKRPLPGGGQRRHQQQWRQRRPARLAAAHRCQHRRQEHPAAGLVPGSSHGTGAVLRILLPPRQACHLRHGVNAFQQAILRLLPSTSQPASPSQPSHYRPCRRRPPHLHVCRWAATCPAAPLSWLQWTASSLASGNRTASVLGRAPLLWRCWRQPHCCTTPTPPPWW